MACPWFNVFSPDDSWERLQVPQSHQQDEVGIESECIVNNFMLGANIKTAKHIRNYIYSGSDYCVKLLIPVFAKEHAFWNRSERLK